MEEHFPHFFTEKRQEKRNLAAPEELFGPLSMRGLENDEYVRQTNGYLPTAEVAFVDEIFKANSAILNALLTLLNERLFDNGHARLKVPLLTLIAASNELPESEELDALYDRFLIRRHVGQVSTQALGRLALLAAGQKDENEAGAGSGAEASSSSSSAAVVPKADELTLDDFKNAAAEAYAAVTLPESVIDLLVALRTHLQDRCEPPVSFFSTFFFYFLSFFLFARKEGQRKKLTFSPCIRTRNPPPTPPAPEIPPGLRLRPPLHEGRQPPPGRRPRRRPRRRRRVRLPPARARLWPAARRRAKG